MPPDVLVPSASSSQWSRLVQAFGEGELPPPCFSLRVHPCGGAPAIETWAVRSFALTERLHAPYALRVTAIADADVDPEALAIASKTKLTHAPFQGAAQAVPANVGGHITGSFLNIADTGPFIKQGKLRLLIVTSAQRDPSWCFRS